MQRVKLGHIRGSPEMGNPEERLINIVLTPTPINHIAGGEKVLVKEELIEIKVANNNRKHYICELNRNVNYGDILLVRQDQLPRGSRIEVRCKCDVCGKSFHRKLVSIKSDITLCDKECKKAFMSMNNPNPKKEKIEKHCNVCDAPILINEAKSKSQEYFLCSRECYKVHRSKLYNKDKIYNFQNLFVKCENCTEQFKVVKYDIENRNNLFCSPECYWEHRANTYVENYYSTDLNDHRKETLPEKLVREWLEKNNIEFRQEMGFLRKYYIDFYLPQYKVFLEVYGDYWHVNPVIYGENLKPLTSHQIGKVEYDLQRVKEIEGYGYPVLIIWEKEVHENIDLYMGKIIDNINKNPQRLHAKPLKLG